MMIDSRNDNDDKSTTTTAAKTTTTSIDDDLCRILKTAGLDSAPMDPQSMIALRQMISEKRQQTFQDKACGEGGTDGATISTTSNNNDSKKPESSLKPPPPSSVSSPLVVSTWQRGETSPPTSESSNSNNTVNNNDYSTSVPSNNHAALPDPTITAALMAQMQQQTQIMMQLQQQVQALHQKVDYLQQQQQQQQQHQQQRRSHELSAVAAAAADATFSPTESSVQSDGERSFTFARTRIYMRPSLSEEESVVSPSAALLRQQQQQQQQQQEEAQRLRRITNRRFVMADRDDDLVVATADSQESVPAGEVTAAAATEPQQGRQQGPEPAPRQLPLLVRIILSPFQLVVRYWQFEYQVLQALFRMGRRDVRPLDGGVLMQLFFVSLVVAKSSRDPSKQQLMISIVVTGFLYHMKVLSFLYKFFVKNNVPLRIWKGMDPEGTDDVYGNNRDAAAANRNNNNNENANGPAAEEPPGLPRPIGHPVAGRGNHGWEDTFLMGGIAAPNNGNNAEGGGVGNPVSRFLWDIIYLFGSFFLSIFPMWRAEQRPRPIPPAEENDDDIPQQQQQHDDDDNDDEEENIGNSDHRRAGGADNDFGQIPTVQPPRDAMEPADSDDEE
ncbi:hypothetical protein IV203_028996 [Nitzschia inconspicua]|uniref:Uncharacterized protein n=1 Tax=Nitzschia inconspicua TaxID=303405 RepID=A0A9K3Q0C9_9STRA|nr:hypothetical protein IV203_028996 [Nitzschia inconspicua]